MADLYVPGTDVVDIGCHSALVTLGMHRFKPITGTLHAFEPQSRQVGGWITEWYHMVD